MKILYITPHLSTGGLPQYLLNKIKTQSKSNDIYCVEWENITGGVLIVQRKQIEELLKNKLYTLDNNKNEIFNIISNINPDVIWFEEIAETFVPESILFEIFSNKRNYFIYETTHSSYTEPNNIKFLPDKFYLVSRWSKQVFDNFYQQKIPCEILEYPVKKRININKELAKQKLKLDSNYKHVLHVGLFTEGKNQKEIIEVAKLCLNENIHFHFVGNQAINFKHYWEPLMQDFPNNCFWWGERDDVDLFYQACDAFYFPSLFELNPLSLKEAISYNLPILIKKLHTYENYYDGLAKYLTDNILTNKNILLEVLNKPLNNYNDELVIICGHCNNEYRKNLLKRSLSNIRLPVLLSTNYPVDEEIQELCDYVLYTPENDILYKEEYSKYNISYNYWFIDDNNTRKEIPFETEHGYAAYRLAAKGLEYAQALGKSRIHIMDYDYFPTNQYLINNFYFIKHNDIVFYKNEDKDFGDNSYCSAFLTGKIDFLQVFYNQYKSKHEYYNDKTFPFLLEIRIFQFYKRKSYRIHEKLLKDLKQKFECNLEGDLQFSKFGYYYNLKKTEQIIQEPKFIINFVDGPYVEIQNAASNKVFEVSFLNKDSNVIEYKGNITNSNWIKCNKSYFIDWKINISDGVNVYEYNLNFTNNKVFIIIDSKSLGDNIAWFPYVEEFRKKHNCHVIVSTFWNELFKEHYPEIEFVEPGSVVNNIVAIYTIGWFYNENNEFNSNKHPKEFKNQPLQKTASDILGLEYKEIKPKINLNKDIINRENIVSIAIHGTTQAKYWNNPEGWQKVVDFLKENGYKVILLSQEHDGYMGNNHPKGIEQLPPGPIENVIETLQKSKFFIGIGSGLSWLSWATNTPTVLISGFSEEYTECKSNTYRISSLHNVCKGCFNYHKLDAGDWNWCPIHKDTKRQFECSKSITPEQVIGKLRFLI